MVDLGSLVLLTSIFGWKIAVAYVVFGLIIAVVGGSLIDKFKMEKYVVHFQNPNTPEIELTTLSVKERFIFAKDQVL